MKLKILHFLRLSFVKMTYWVDKHPGGAYNIQKWSQNNGTILVYPGLLERQPHGMANWNNNWKKFTYVGRFGDSIKTGDLSNDLRTMKVIEYFDDTGSDNSGDLLVCGSPGEVSNARNEEFQFEAYNSFQTLSTYQNSNHVWTMIALKASDQLRQRVAWAFSQVSLPFAAFSILFFCHFIFERI